MATTAAYSATSASRAERTTHVWRIRRKVPLYLMLLPAFVTLFVFRYVPMAGLVMVFQNYKPLMGFWKSPFVGFANFERLFASPDFWQLVRNTLVISTGKIVFGLIVSLGFALLLHEVRQQFFKRTVQTITYALYFLSWILFGGILLDVLGADGVVNGLIKATGLPGIPFLTSPDVFPWTLVVTDVWKGFGMGAVIYLAALADVDPALYEAAAVDGAGRWHRLRHVTLPSITSTAIVLTCLNLGWVLYAGMEQVLVLYNPAVYSTGDIIETFVYRVGLQDAQFSLAATVGLFQSAIGLILISLSYYLAYRIANYRIF
jgi:putative aldouronate transport system permease protein